MNKRMFQKIEEGILLITTQPTTALQLFCELIIDIKTIFNSCIFSSDGIIELVEICRHECVEKETHFPNLHYFLGYFPKMLLLDRYHHNSPATFGLKDRQMAYLNFWPWS